MEVRFALVLDENTRDPDHWHASGVATHHSALPHRHDGHVILLPRRPGDRRVGDVTAEDTATGKRTPAGIYRLSLAGVSPAAEGAEGNDNMKQVPYDPSLPLVIEIDCTSPHQVEHFVVATPPGEPPAKIDEGSGTPHEYFIEGLPVNSRVRVGLDFFSNSGTPFRGTVDFVQIDGPEPTRVKVTGSGTGAKDVEVIVV